MKSLTHDLTRLAATVLAAAALAAPWPAHAAPITGAAFIPPTPGPVYADALAVARINAKADALGAGFTGKARAAWEYVPGGYRVRYQECDIYTASAGAQAFEVHGDIRAKYNLVGGPWSDLGLPQSDDSRVEPAFVKGQGHYNAFAGGQIVWAPDTGPMVLKGTILKAWIASGGFLGPLGYPIRDPQTDGQPARVYSDFQNGVLYTENGQLKDPLKAYLTKDEVVKLTRKFFEDNKGDDELHVRWVTIDSVSDTEWDFMHSRNRIVTFKINGWRYHTVKDTDFTLTLPLLIYQQGEGQFFVTGYSIRAALMPGWKVETSGWWPYEPKVHEALVNGIQNLFQNPVDLSNGNWIPANAGLLSVKTMPDGGLSLFFRYNAIAAPITQQALENMLP